MTFIDQGAGLAIDERLHVANEVVREPDVESGCGFEPRDHFRGQRDGEGTQVVEELIKPAHAHDRVHAAERVIAQASATCDRVAPSSSARSWTV